MKRICKLTFALLSVVLAFSLVACGGKNNSDGTTGSVDSKSNNKPTVVVTNNGGDTDTVKASGTITEQSYALNGGPYTIVAHGVSMTNGTCEIVISPTEDNNCVVAVDDNIDISVAVNEDSKRIEITGDSGKTCEGVSLKIAINSAVEAVDVDGAFVVTYDAGTAEQVEITATGACKITAAGECQTGRYNLSGVVQLSAYEMKCDNLNVSSEGTCSAEVYASQELTAKASGTSSIRYDGDPQSTSINATGLASIEAR